MRRAVRTAPWLVRLAAVCLAFAVAILAVPAMAAGLADFLGKAAPSELVPGADA